jgi:transcription antitermination factor NusG
MPEIVEPVLPEFWYVVHTRSNFEKRVHGELVSKGLEAYLPAVREVHQWKDRKKLVELPVFPGYLFARFRDTDENRLTVLRSSGAVRLLGPNGSLEPVPEAEVDSVRRLVDSGTPFSLHPFLREGARVRVKGGPLEGVEGILVAVKNQARLVISVQMLAQSVAVEIDMRRVEVVRTAARPAA